MIILGSEALLRENKNDKMLAPVEITCGPLLSGLTGHLLVRLRL